MAARQIPEAGVPMTAAEAAGTFEGMLLKDIRAEVEALLGESLPAHWLGDFEKRRAAEFEKGLDPIAGVAEVLVEVRKAGISACVATQASREKAELTLGLTGLRAHFETEELFSSRMVERGKPPSPAGA
ncbi:MAG TPA: HAD hydrolase-like protein [Solirubrobacterales bacterium]|nr:HAD hydrolase-like protein [Solirubrobacterales bacterium]